MALKFKTTDNIERIVPEVSEVKTRIASEISTALAGIGPGANGNGGGSQINVAGEVVESVSFSSDPQEQLDAQSERIDELSEEATAKWISLNNVDNRSRDNSNQIAAINQKIPNQASSTNQLADKAFVNSTFTSLAANRVFYNVAGAQFPTRASLISATTFYRDGAVYIPSKDDYTIVTADESAPSPFTGGQTRWKYSGTQWNYDFGINERPFTAAEQSALISNITQAIVEDTKEHLVDTIKHVTQTDKDNWDGKLDKITSTSAYDYRAYIVTSTGLTQGTLSISTGANGGTIARRNLTGATLNVGTPTADEHAATKEYVDTKVESSSAIRYIASLIWSGSAGNYSMSITATTHGKGINPKITVYNTAGNAEEVGVNRTTAGNITLFSESNFTGTVVIL